MLMPVPLEWEMALPAMLNLAEVWSLRPMVRATSNEICEDENLSNAGRWFSNVLARMVKAKLLTHQRTKPSGYRLAKTPSRITVHDIFQSCPRRNGGTGYLSHVGRRYPVHEIRRTRSSRGYACPNDLVLGKAEAVLEATFRKTTLATVLAANLGLKPVRLPVVDEGPTRQWVRSIRERLHPVLAEFCPLVEVLKGVLVAWPHKDIAEAFSLGFENWFEELQDEHLNRFVAPRKITDRNLGELRARVLDWIAELEADREQG